LALLAAVGLLTSCSDGQAEIPVPPDDPALSPPSVAQSTSDRPVSEYGDGHDAIPHFVGPWADEMARTYRYAISDFTRAVLADGYVTPAEVREANGLVIDCVLRAGLVFDYEITEHTITWINFPSNADARAVRRDCHNYYLGGEEDILGVRAHADLIQLHLWLTGDPEGAHTHANVLSCLRRRGVAGPDFTWDQLAEIMWHRCGQFSGTADEARADDCFTQVIPVGDRDPFDARDEIMTPGAITNILTLEGAMYIVIENPDYSWEPGVFPGGHSPDDPQVQGCFNNPLG
jgi:hypothetical protein